MGIVDGFWFQVGRAAADIVLAFGMIAAIFVCVLIWALLSAAYEYHKHKAKRNV